MVKSVVYCDLCGERVGEFDPHPNVLAQAPYLTVTVARIPHEVCNGCAHRRSMHELIEAVSKKAQVPGPPGNAVDVRR